MHGITRFATFELNLRTGELRNRGIRLRLWWQSAQILGMLIERPGEVVTAMRSGTSCGLAERSSSLTTA